MDTFWTPEHLCHLLVESHSLSKHVLRDDRCRVLLWPTPICIFWLWGLRNVWRRGMCGSEMYQTESLISLMAVNIFPQVINVYTKCILGSKSHLYTTIGLNFTSAALSMMMMMVTEHSDICQSQWSYYRIQNLNPLSHPNATLVPQSRQARASGENLNYLLSHYSYILS